MMFAYFGHILPIVDDSMFDWILQFEDTSMRVGLMADEHLRFLTGCHYMLEITILFSKYDEKHLLLFIKG